MTMVDGGVHGGSGAMTAAPGWLSPESYWQPSHIVTSAWLEHAPFAFWLMAQLRPRTVVELGTHYGFSFFVLAEAAKRLGLDAELYALDTWEGDDHTGFYDEHVFDQVESIARTDYPHSTHLVRGYFSESRSRIADDSVDLLHIDGRHAYEDVREDYEQWASTVRNGGVILFHDIAERAQDFGVWRLWDEISSNHSSFAFSHGHGLGVIGVGEPATGRLANLFRADESIARRVRADYARLGSVVSRQAVLEAMPAEVDSLHVVVDSLSSEIERLNEIIDEQEAVIGEIRSSRSWRVTRPLRAIASAFGRGRHG
jgi:hypothetical protein